MEIGENFYKEMFTKDELRFIFDNNITITKVNEWAKRKVYFNEDMTFEMSEKYSEYLEKLENYVEGGFYEKII